MFRLLHNGLAGFNGETVDADAAVDVVELRSKQDTHTYSSSLRLFRVFSNVLAGNDFAIAPHSGYRVSLAVLSSFAVLGYDTKWTLKLKQSWGLDVLCEGLKEPVNIFHGPGGLYVALLFLKSRAKERVS